MIKLYNESKSKTIINNEIVIQIHDYCENSQIETIIDH